VREALGDNPSVTLVEPLGYRELVALLERATLVLTDSGGLQEEAPTLGLPVLVLRDVTERLEGVDAGTVKLVGTRRERIVDEALALLGSRGELSLMSRPLNPYGDGRAAERIVAALVGEAVDEWLPEIAPTSEPLRLLGESPVRVPAHVRLRAAARRSPLRLRPAESPAEHA
jgi:UDP-N-acetylglucosamine 2-epimerase (non-hydrolysing)